MAELTDMQTTVTLKRLAKLYFGEVAQVTPLKGDGSDRCIYRIHPMDGTCDTIIGIVHQNLDENRDFLRITGAFHQAGLNAPRVLSVSDDEIAYLLQDLGDDTLADCVVDWRNGGSESLILDAYRRVIDSLVRIQGELPSILGEFLRKRPMDRTVFQTDLDYFKRDFVRRFNLEEALSSAVECELSEILDELSDASIDGCFVYRDFQARNIMWFNDEPWFIDYQSAFLGSRCYDLASLLYGSKAGLANDHRGDLLIYYYRKIKPQVSVDFGTFQRLFLLFVLMRRLRSLGTYGYLAGEKGKAGFFESIYPTLVELDGLLRSYPALEQYDGLRKMICRFRNAWR